MFDLDPKARGDLKPGTVYAICAPDQSIFYGQVCPDKSIAFFERRDRTLANAAVACSGPVMARLSVYSASIGRALRQGVWKKLGRAELAAGLTQAHSCVNWPVGTLNVNVWGGASVVRTTRVEDPTIQNMEIMAVWDAEQHVPLRLLVDRAPREADAASDKTWTVGGPIWRERRLREERARRFPNGPHALPPDWVPTSRPAGG